MISHGVGLWFGLFGSCCLCSLLIWLACCFDLWLLALRLSRDCWFAFSVIVVLVRVVGCLRWIDLVGIGWL